MVGGWGLNPYHPPSLPMQSCPQPNVSNFETTATIPKNSCEKECGNAICGAKVQATYCCFPMWLSVFWLFSVFLLLFWRPFFFIFISQETDLKKPFKNLIGILRNSQYIPVRCRAFFLQAELLFFATGVPFLLKLKMPNLVWKFAACWTFQVELQFIV